MSNGTTSTGTTDILTEATGTPMERATSATRAMTPTTPGGLTTFGPQVPQMPPPLPLLPNIPMAQPAQGEFATSGGRKRADTNALVNSLAQGIRGGVEYIQAKKQRALTMDLERLLSAMSGLNEAQAAGNQEGIQKNTAIMNDMLSDPKKVKLFEKAFNVDLLGNAKGKNKNENAALAQAIKNHKEMQDFEQKRKTDPTALNPYAQRLQASQPWHEQLSPQAQMEAMAIKAGLIPKADIIMESYQKNLDAYLKADSADKRTAALDNIARLKVEADRNKIKALTDIGLAKIKSADDRAALASKTAYYRADQQLKGIQARIASAEKMTGLKEGDRTYIAQVTDLANRIKTLNEDNNKIQTEIDKKGSKFFGWAQSAATQQDIARMRVNMMVNQKEINLLQQQVDTMTLRKRVESSMGQSMLGGVLSETPQSTTEQAPTGEADTTEIEKQIGASSIDVPEGDIPPE